MKFMAPKKVVRLGHSLPPEDAKRRKQEREMAGLLRDNPLDPMIPNGQPGDLPTDVLRIIEGRRNNTARDDGETAAEKLRRMEDGRPLSTS